MNKYPMGLTVALLVGVGAGIWMSGYRSQIPWLVPGLESVAAAGMEAGEKPLFWRNPMNPAITSPVFTKDEMGMDYLPVYADAPKTGKKERKVLFWRNPMNPAITSPVFTKDEMGMDYLPVYADDGGAADEPTGTVKIDPVTVQNIGVRTVKAKRQAFSRSVRALGRVIADETRITRLHPKTEGWIEKLFINKTGEPVKKDDILFSIYSPKLVSSQHEYLLALRNLKALGESEYPDIREGARQMAEISRERLQLLDVPEHQIRELEQSGKPFKALHVHSPFDGIVMKLNVSEGEYVTPRSELYRLADLSKVWVQVDVYEYELSRVRVGDKAQITLKSMPGRIFEGTVSYIYPYAEARTRTIKVRLELDNPELALKPDMFADVTLNTELQKDAVVVPDAAIVRSGERDQVFIVREPGKFEPREVTLGQSSEGWVQVLDGVKAGEEVVASALFLIDSESKLREATAKMMEAAKGGQSVGGADMDMQGMAMDAPDMSMDEMRLDSSVPDAMDMSGFTLDGGRKP
ncbi:efflux RND transporter periplasmic adaptor subunit [endosymbiont of Riftia pachyptila]|uniref:Putative Co/Zn/Cd efflux system membrane fusion protein n=1 Tax=endosymbiont of Riftia pachyptila (vent Ph05) TaxID=1048808 RepID=G2DGR8_9GAMM|nr:efflux RND transporter periplasmic adaptor subunit [endosymbiont of Riftia pachyptila]EGV50190.1 putative Co/Zn/Cd efflux system membrane fusion protein [endosymbiont of Riftia pachyptila (vent Ph05)]